jgi:prepilin-type processing-associated H-X9-DG protein
MSGLSVFDPNFGADGVIVQTSPVRIPAITDGTSNTILFGEFSNVEPNFSQYYFSVFGVPNIPISISSNWVTWFPGQGATGYYPLNGSKLPPSIPTDPAPLQTVLFERLVTYGSGHMAGANFAFCDGSVHFLTNAAAGTTGGLLSALSTRAGGEVINYSGF